MRLSEFARGVPDPLGAPHEGGAGPVVGPGQSPAIGHVGVTFAVPEPESQPVPESYPQSEPDAYPDGDGDPDVNFNDFITMAAKTR